MVVTSPTPKPSPGLAPQAPAVPSPTPNPAPGPPPQAPPPPAPIPGAPAKPKSDAGAGEWDSEPWYSRGEDIAYAKIAAAVVDAADALGYTHAAAHLDHYLDNTGDTLDVNVDSVLHDVPEANTYANGIAAKEIRRIAAAAVAASDYDRLITFETPWDGDFYIKKSMNDDWFFAMGGIWLSATGVVITREGAEGAAPNVEVEYRIHLYDRYNWDDGKETEILFVTVSDETLAGLHTAGLAREYDIEGTSDVRKYSGPVPSDGAMKLPGSKDSRDGERTDPGRQRN
ncbi:hypothetical protein ACFVMC_32595 [Nocardia sp. NPDC127579]|uniref:hypothetical protein n=1 Tax=Nocardia sp. NPDC127579 TaxID=3345402 RepID=UPI003635652A